MPPKTKALTPVARVVAVPATTLASVLAALGANCGLAPTRLRDLRSAVRRVAALLGNELAAIPFDMAVVSAGLATVNPVAVGMTAKRLSNRICRPPSVELGGPLSRKSITTAWKHLWPTSEPTH